MDPSTIIILTICAACLVGLAFMSGHEHGRRNGIVAARIAERSLADKRIQGLLARENSRAPRTGRARK